MSTADLSEADYGVFRDFLERQCGIVLGENKQYLVRSRLSPLLREFAISCLADLVNQVTRGRDQKLHSAVIDAMTTNETLWFRDNYPFQLLQEHLLPSLAAKRQPLRIWSAACSSGQEPYSIAMSLLEYQEANKGAFSSGIEIVATDISKAMLSRCESALYDNLSLSRGLSMERRRRFFAPAGSDGSMQLKSEVTRLVKFRLLNLLDGYQSLGRFDLVFCRNVLIYFSAASKKKILQQIAACLQPEGILFLGASESISGLTDDFSMTRCSPGLYYQKK